MISTAEAMGVVLRNEVSDLFKKAGFHKKGRQFFKWQGDVCQLAHFYSSQFSFPGNVMFTLEANIFVKYIQETITGSPFPKAFIDATPVVANRFGQSMKKPLQTPFAEFWTIRNEEEAFVIAKQIHQRCAQDVLPYLEHFGSESNIIKQLTATTTDSNFFVKRGRLALMQAKLGLTSEAQDTLSAVMAKFKQDGHAMREIDHTAVNEFLSRIKIFVETKA